LLHGQAGWLAGWLLLRTEDRARRCDALLWALLRSALCLRPFPRAERRAVDSGCGFIRARLDRRLHHPPPPPRFRYTEIARTGEHNRASKTFVALPPPSGARERPVAFCSPAISPAPSSSVIPLSRLLCPSGIPTESPSRVYASAFSPSPMSRQECPPRLSCARCPDPLRHPERTLRASPPFSPVTSHFCRFNRAAASRRLSRSQPISECSALGGSYFVTSRQLSASRTWSGSSESEAKGEERGGR